MNNEYFDITGEDIYMESRKSMFDDWRDWFILENKQESSVYETKLRIYIEDSFVKEMLIPINLKTLSTKFNLSIKLPICINEMKYIIPEMSILRCVKFDMPRRVAQGDTCVISTNLIFSE